MFTFVPHFDKDVNSDSSYSSAWADATKSQNSTASFHSTVMSLDPQTRRDPVLLVYSLLCRWWLFLSLRSNSQVLLPPTGQLWLCYCMFFMIIRQDDKTLQYRSHGLWCLLCRIGGKMCRCVDRNRKNPIALQPIIQSSHAVSIVCESFS